MCRGRSNSENVKRFEGSLRFGKASRVVAVGNEKDKARRSMNNKGNMHKTASWTSRGGGGSSQDSPRSEDVCFVGVKELKKTSRSKMGSVLLMRGKPRFYCLVRYFIYLFFSGLVAAFRFCLARMTF